MSIIEFGGNWQLDGQLGYYTLRGVTELGTKKTMAARGGGAMERDEGIRGLRDPSSLLQGSSLVLDRSRVAAPTGPLPNPVAPSSAQTNFTRRTHMWGKLCFSMKCYDDVANEYGDDWGIYIVDLNDDASDKWIFKAPSLRFSRESFNFGYLCLLGDILYVIDGDGGRKVWKYKLPISPEIVDRRLDMGDLVEVNPMTCPKPSPFATSTPDGKLLVLTREICWLRFGKKTDEFNFELYDPHRDLWEQLPGLSIGNCMDAHASIHGLAFQNNEPIVVILTNFGMFRLDIRPSENNKQWKPFVPSSGSCCSSVARGGECRFILMGDDYLLNSSGAHELVGEEARFFKYPQLPDFGYYDYKRSAANSVLLNMTNKNEGCFFCVMESHIKRDTAIPHTVINMYRFDYVRFKEDLEQGRAEGPLLPGTKLIKSFKFLFRPHISEGFFYTLWFGYIPPGKLPTTY